MRATEILREEHEVIRRVLDCLEIVADRADARRALDVRSASDVLEFLGVFADRCHHGKEERRLFPALVRRGVPERVGPVAVMLAEHEQGRAEIRSMRSALEDAQRLVVGADERFAATAREYVGLLRQHIEKENGALFPIADRLLSDAEQRKMLSDFETVETEELGSFTHELYLELARSLCDRFDVPWVAEPLDAVAGGAHHGAMR